MRTITYAIDRYTGLVFSRVGSEVAIPVLDWEGMKPENNFRTEYHLEIGSVHEAYQGTDLKWTRKLSNNLKNIHRAFWGMKPLKGKNRWEA